MHGIFESVEFLNEEKATYYEVSILDESTEVLNEQLFLKFIKKKNVTEEFRDEALKVLEALERETGKAATDETSLAGALGVRNAKKKIKEGKLKNCYIVGFKYREITKAADVDRKIMDFLIIRGKTIGDYATKVLTSVGYKKVSQKMGANYAFVKEGKDCLYGVDVAIIDTRITFYIRCLENSEENKKILAGGKKFYESDKKND